MFRNRGNLSANVHEKIVQLMQLNHDDIYIQSNGVMQMIGNDWQAAINEMIRVAKSGTKIVIVDETEKLIESTYKRTPITKDYYESADKIGTPIELIPEDMLDVTCREVCQELMYCLTFRKP